MIQTLRVTKFFTVRFLWAFLVSFLCYASLGFATDDPGKAIIPGLGLGLSDVSFAAALIFTVRWFMGLTEKSLAEHRSEREQEASATRTAAATATTGFLTTLTTLEARCEEEQKRTISIFNTMLAEQRLGFTTSIDKLVASFAHLGSSVEHNAARLERHEMRIETLSEDMRKTLVVAVATPPVKE